MTYLSLLLGSHFYLLLVILFVFIIEKITGNSILVFWFLYKKDLKTAIGTADREALLYFLYNNGYVIYKVYIKGNFSGEFNFIIWLIIIIVLTVIVRKLYFKYQGIDKDKPDFLGKL